LVTGALFLFSWIGQFVFQAAVESNEASQHGQSFAWAEFLPQFLASTFENWQSEFLQLIWQAAGLALFYYWGSSQSRESDERIEAKLDALLRERNLDPENP
jgi:ferric iron reductase protein FhuF